MMTTWTIQLADGSTITIEAEDLTVRQSPALDHCSNAYLDRLSAARSIKPANRGASHPCRHDS